MSRPIKNAIFLLGLIACSEPLAGSLIDSGPQPDAGVAPAIDWAPESFGGKIPSPDDNPLSEAGIALGHRLFYDRRLSADGEVSCANCHNARRAFSDGIPQSSDGVSGQTLARHVPVLQNLAWHDQGLFWDGAAIDLETQALVPLTHIDEMGSDLAELVAQLSADESYVAAFDLAFAESPSEQTLARALAQFVRSLVSANSRYDQIIAGKGVFSLSEERGFGTFERLCASCHPAPFFSDHGFHNLGLEAEFSNDPEDVRKGRGRVTGAPEDFGSFKTPSLRNLGVSAPYFHDGRLATLRQVLEFFDHGIVAAPNVDAFLVGEEGLLGLPMSAAEMDDLEDFLATLDDPEFITRVIRSAL
jgi:cytochrome c peroxidase